MILTFLQYLNKYYNLRKWIADMSVNMMICSSLKASSMEIDEVVNYFGHPTQKNELVAYLEKSIAEVVLKFE